MQSIEAGFRDKFKIRFNKLRGDMTQAEFAEFLGISRPTVGFYENGSRIPDAFTLRKIATKCGVPADYLLGITDALITDNTQVNKDLGLSDEAISALKFLKKKADESTENRVWDWHLQVVNHIIAYGGKRVISPIVSYISMALKQAKSLKEGNAVCWESLGQPSTFEDLQSVLTEVSKENHLFDPNDIFFSELQFAEWKLYKDQRVFTEKVVAKIYNSQWEEMNHGERNKD